MILSHLQTRLQFIEIADQFNNEILQARRFEKNYFLYGTNLEDVLLHIDTADGHLSSSKTEFGSIVGLASLERLEGHLRLYRELIVQLRSIEGPDSEERAARRAEIEATLRTHGAELVSSALELAQRERNTVRTLLRVSKGVPVALPPVHPAPLGLQRRLRLAPHHPAAEPADGAHEADRRGGPVHLPRSASTGTSSPTSWSPSTT